MKKIAICVLLIGFAVTQSGCLVIRTKKKCPPSDASEAIEFQRDPVIEEINAVSKLNMSSDRERFYIQIAKRNPLAPPAQVALVKTAYRDLNMSSSKVNLSLALIGNPSFCPAAKSEILRGLDKLHMSSDKAKVLDAIGKRGPLTPPVIVVEEPVIIAEDK